MTESSRSCGKHEYITHIFADDCISAIVRKPFFLGMAIMLEIFHSVGKLPVVHVLVIMICRALAMSGFFNISAGILSVPGHLL